MSAEIKSFPHQNSLSFLRILQEELDRRNIYITQYRELVSKRTRKILDTYSNPPYPVIRQSVESVIQTLLDSEEIETYSSMKWLHDILSLDFDYEIQVLLESYASENGYNFDDILSGKVGLTQNIVKQVYFLYKNPDLESLIFASSEKDSDNKTGFIF